MREAVRRALPRPRGRVPAPPRPGPAQPRQRRAPTPPALAWCAHTPSPERRPRRSDPRLSGRRCSGEPRCACACGSASDCSTASAVSPPPSGVRGWPRVGTISRGGRDGRGIGPLGAWGSRGEGTGSPGIRTRDGARQTRPGPAKLRDGWTETAGGSDTGRRLHRSAGMVLGVLDHRPLWVARLLWSLAASHRILSEDPALAYQLPGGVPALHRARLPSAQPGPYPAIPAGPQTWVRTSRRLPAAPEIGPPEGARGRCPPSPARDYGGRGSGTTRDSRRRADWAQVHRGT